MSRAARTSPEEQLELLLQGALDPDEAPAELRELLALASSLRELPLERPQAAFKVALRERVVNEAAWAQTSLLTRVRDGLWDRTARIRHSARMAMATGVASAMLGTAGVAAAAQYALPGELLHPVKLATESARHWLASGDLAEGRLDLRFAAERLEELTDGAETLPADELITTLERMDDASIRGSEALLRVFRETRADALLVELADFAAAQRAGLTVALDLLPGEVRPFASQSLEVLRRIEVQVEDEAAAACDCEDAPAATIPGDGDAPSDGPAISPPGEGPARPSRSCDCTSGPAPAATPDRSDDPTVGQDDAGPASSDPPGDTGTTDGTDPADDGRTVVPEVPGLGPVNDVTEPVDDDLGEVIDDLPIDDLIVEDPTGSADLPGSVAPSEDQLPVSPGG